MELISGDLEITNHEVVRQIYYITYMNKFYTVDVSMHTYCVYDEMGEYIVGELRNTIYTELTKLVEQLQHH